MTIDEAKDEILALIGPDANLVAWLRRGGLHIYDWEDKGVIEIKFMISEGPIIDWPRFKMKLEEGGKAVGLFLKNYGYWWTGALYEGHADFTRKRPEPFVLTNNDDCR